MTKRLMTHELKTWPEPFAALLDGRKTFEIRKYDRPFLVGDTLHLREWNPDGSGYTGRETAAVVTYLVSPGAWGLPPDLCVMGLASCSSPAPLAAPPETPAAREEWSPLYRNAVENLGAPASAPRETPAPTDNDSNEGK